MKPMLVNFRLPKTGQDSVAVDSAVGQVCLKPAGVASPSVLRDSQRRRQVGNAQYAGTECHPAIGML
jgi:hypothetical protein